MKVRFDFSLADLADVAERISGRSKTVHAWRREARMLWAALISLALFFAIEGDIVARALYAALAFVGLLALYPLVFRGSPKGRYIEYYREQLGSDGPFQCEVEITSEGVTVEQRSSTKAALVER